MSKKKIDVNNRFGADRKSIRNWFPSLESSDVFLDNAGGSQMPGVVANSIRDYFLGSYVQVGADYETARRATDTITRAREFVSLFMNGRDLGHVMFGPSTSALCNMLADCYTKAPDPRKDEIIVCESGHEANVGPWVRLFDRGFKVKTWCVDKETLASEMSELKKLLGERTRIVAVPHVSNLLGNIDDVREVTRLAHEVGARVVIDAVAYAPHRAIDVEALDVDWYVYSVYKVMGPHMAVMFGKRDAFLELEGPNHFFVDKGDVPYKFELGGVLHEGCAGILGLRDYLGFLADKPASAPVDRETIETAFGVMTELELPLQKKLIDYLLQKPSVRLIGPRETGPSRVGTISFVHESKTSKEIVLAVNDRGLGIRYGHFYAHRLATAAGLEPEDGVVRTSLLHYNTEAEIDRLINCFEELL